LPASSMSWLALDMVLVHMPDIIGIILILVYSLY
jgi:hypothetical protein